MGEQSTIEWTEATFNPWWGCAHVSPGCAHCYADTWDKRTGGDHFHKGGPRRTFGDAHWAEPVKWNRKAERRGEPMLVFCASMGDVFEDHPALPAERERLWDLIEATPWLIWQVLTKRPENVAAMVPAEWLHQGEALDDSGTRYAQTWPANVWLGTSVEDQQRADERIPALLRIPAGVRFLSVEPLLAPVDLSQPLGVEYMDALEGYGHEMFASLQGRVGGAGGIHWVIVGGESGPHARPMHPDWARSIRDQVTAAGVPFLFKQWGDWHPLEHRLEGRGYHRFDDGQGMARLGKHAGRALDGRTWDQLPPKIFPNSIASQQVMI